MKYLVLNVCKNELCQLNLRGVDGFAEEKGSGRLELLGYIRSEIIAMTRTAEVAINLGVTAQIVF